MLRSPVKPRFAARFAVGERAMLASSSVLDLAALKPCIVLTVLPGEDHHAQACYRIHCDNEAFDRVVNESDLALPN